MSLGDVYKLDLFQQFLGQKVMNSLHFATKQPATPIMAEALSLAMDWKDFIKTYQPATLTHLSWRLTQVAGVGVTYDPSTCRPSGGFAFEGTYTGVVVGTGAGEALPPQCARVTTILTGLVGRSRRGRFYQAGIIEGVTQNGDFGSGEMATYQAGWDAQFAKFREGGTNLVWQGGVFSFTIASGCKPGIDHPHALTNVQTGNQADAFKEVTAYKCRPIVYTQRRRTLGVGS